MLDANKDERVDYEKPRVVDYGSLTEITASGGTKFSDSPIGTPIGDVTASSTP